MVPRPANQEALTFPAEPLLVVDGLDVTFAADPRSVPAVRDVSFRLDRGRCLALVGESGSGKSVTARTLVGLTGGRSTVTARRLAFAGEDLTAFTEPRWRTLRGRRIGLVLQDALVSLDPLRTVGAEIAETLRTHRVVPRAGLEARTLSLLTEVGVPEPEQRARQYPHQLSGGLRQRALIASAIAAGPDLVLADEPTTALDVTVQAQVLDLLRRRKQDGAALLLISHDLAVVGGLADDIAVMYAGRIVEEGPAAQVLGDPRHPYTRALLDAVPVTHAKGARLAPAAVRHPAPTPSGCPYAGRCPRSDLRCRDQLPERVVIPTRPDVAAAEPGVADGRPTVGTGHAALCWYPTVDAPAVLDAVDDRPASGAGPGVGRPVTAAALLEVDGISKRFRSPDGTSRAAVRDVSLRLHPGETLGIVGESGSGKTTVARIVLGLLEPDGGTVRFAGRPWGGSGVREPDRRGRRRHIQAIYQDPLGSFDPRYRVERIIGEAAATAGVTRAGRGARVAELLEQVGLSADLMGRRPLELSGGQRQRVAIARALAPGPDLIVCDEPVSALDVSVQAQILDLLAGLQSELGVALLFISHDLGVIHHVSDRIVVMKDGAVVETGEVAQVFAHPAAGYTRELLAAVPRPVGGRTAPPDRGASTRVVVTTPPAP